MSRSSAVDGPRCSVICIILLPSSHKSCVSQVLGQPQSEDIDVLGGIEIKQESAILALSLPPLNPVQVPAETWQHARVSQAEAQPVPQSAQRHASQCVSLLCFDFAGIAECHWALSQHRAGGCVLAASPHTLAGMSTSCALSVLRPYPAIFTSSIAEQTDSCASHAAAG